MPEFTAEGQCNSSNVMPVPVLFNSLCSAVVGSKWKKEVLLLQAVTLIPITDFGNVALGTAVGV